MIRKDYLLRMFQLLIDAINDILNNIKNGEIKIAKIQITNTYQLFDNDASIFLNTNIDGIIQFFFKKDAKYLKKIAFLSELMYYDSSHKKKNSWKKCT